MAAIVSCGRSQQEGSSACVASFGLNGNCAGTGCVFRMDRANVLDFVNSYLATSTSRGRK